MKATIEEILMMYEKGFEFIIADGKLKGVTKRGTGKTF